MDAEATVLRNARVIDPSTSLDEVADVVVESGVITQVGRGAAEAAAGERVEVIEAQGCWLTPGFIDLHVHFREPGQEYKEDIASGLRAAAAGGFTTVTAMPNTSPVNDCRSVTELMTHAAAGGCRAKLHVIGAVTRDLQGEELAHITDMREAGIIGISDDGRCVMKASIMRSALEHARELDVFVSQHAEDHTLTSGAQINEGLVSTRLGLRGWPTVAEDIIVARDLLLAEYTGARYHVAHLSSRGALRLIQEAKARGLQVTAEVTPHHLLLDEQRLLSYDTHCKVNPPLRSAEDVEALREGLRDGTINCIATDHAPHAPHEKDCEFENACFGMTGLETAFPVLLQLVRDGAMTLSRLVEAMTHAPAQVGRINGGSLKPGTAADLTLIHPERKWTVKHTTLHSKSANSPWLESELTGAIAGTMVGGRWAYMEEEAMRDSASV